MRNITIVLLFVIQISAQNNLYINRIGDTFAGIYDGFENSLEWYDIPIGAIYLSRHILNNSSWGDLIFVPPTSFEIDFNNSFSSDKNSSPGSMNKDLIPHAIFLSRIGVNVVLDIFSNREISSSPYQSAFLFQKSLIYTYTITELAKNIFKRTRPDNTDDRSFFSGHTSTTFAAATFLFLELNRYYNNVDWLSENSALKKVFKSATFAGLYGWAGYVGYCRIKDNRHYLSDVLVGASIGTLISFLVYDQYMGDSESALNNINVQKFDDMLLLSFSLQF